MEVVKVAWPPLRLLVASAVAPSLKVTVPVGVPLPGATTLTLAVKITGWPNTVELVEELSATLLAFLLTVWLRAAEVPVLKLASPL